MAAITTLAGFWLWGLIDGKVLATASKRYRPVERQDDDPSFNIDTSDVSVIVPTVDTKASFPTCLQTWVANNPGEIIIIGIEKQRDHIAGLVQRAALSPDLATKIKILYAPAASKRDQFRLGIEESTGSIIVNVDDHIIWSDEFLQHTLPCFQEKSVGAVGTPLTIHIPPHRRNSKSITPWETAMMRALWKRNRGLEAVYAAYGWCWVLAGSTVVFRAEILKDPRFLHGLTKDYWLGRYKLDTGDDTFSSRWLQQHDWKIAIQSTPATEVSRTTVKTGSAFFEQAFRWERSTIQSYLRTLRDVSQIWKKPYVARKTIERVCRPLLTGVHIYAWIRSFMTYPTLASLLLLYYVWDSSLSYGAFLGRYPYMRRHLWAAVLIDYFYVIQDVWSWLTLNDTSWRR